MSAVAFALLMVGLVMVGFGAELAGDEHASARVERRRPRALRWRMVSYLGVFVVVLVARLAARGAL